MVQFKHSVEPAAPEYVPAAQLLQLEAPRHFFPYARSILSNTTRDGGFPPLLINPVDFGELYLRKHQAAAKAAEGAEERA